MGKLLRRAWHYLGSIHLIVWIYSMIPTSIAGLITAFFGYLEGWPKWLCAILGFLGCCFGFFLLFLVIGYVKSKPTRHKPADAEVPTQRAEPSWKSYTEDTIYSILWHWRYFRIFFDSIDNAIVEDSLTPLCPKCSRELTKAQAERIGRGSLLFMKCPNPRCDFKSKTFDQDYYQLTKDVLVEIRGRIRSEEYKKVSSLRNVVGGAFFLNPPCESLKIAFSKAKERNVPVFAVIYDSEHPELSHLSYSLGNFLKYRTTKALVDKLFVAALLPSSQEDVWKLIPKDDPLENCRLVVIRTDGHILYSEGVYANPDEGLKRVQRIITEWKLDQT